MNDGLKQRLLGAVVLVGIAVIFLPGFFKQHNQYPVDTHTQIPAAPKIQPAVIAEPQVPADAEPAPDPENMFVPQSDQPVDDDLAAVQARTAASASSAQSSRAAASASSSSSVLSSQSSSSPTSSAHRQASQASSTAIAKPHAWVVQVASLRKSASAQQLRKKLQARGYKAYVRVATTSKGDVNRVFIGPKLDKKAVLSIKKAVDSTFKVNSLVLPFKP